MNELIVVHGIDIVAMSRAAAEAARLETLIPSGTTVSFKPNLVVAKVPSSGAVTHPRPRSPAPSRTSRAAFRTTRRA
ncbi:MAG: hypothetical protein ABIJ86_16875, partial [Spirochaetota bacterium]